MIKVGLGASCAMALAKVIGILNKWHLSRKQLTFPSHWPSRQERRRGWNWPVPPGA